MEGRWSFFFVCFGRKSDLGMLHTFLRKITTAIIKFYTGTDCVIKEKNLLVTYNKKNFTCNTFLLIFGILNFIFKDHTFIDLLLGKLSLDSVSENNEVSDQMYPFIDD